MFLNISTLIVGTCRFCTHGFGQAVVPLITTFIPKTSLILHCVVADVVTSKMQIISSFDAIYIVSTDLNYVILLCSIVMFLLLCYSVGTSLLAMRPTRVSLKLYIYT